MNLQVNLSDPAEVLGWRILFAEDLEDEIHQTLADARAAYRARHPEADLEAAAAFSHYCAQQLKAAGARIAARHRYFEGMQIGGSA
jgi:hypothetical protein